MDILPEKHSDQSWPQAFAELRDYLRIAYRRIYDLEHELKIISLMAEEGRQTVTDCVTKVIQSEVDSAAAITRGHFLAISQKIDAILKEK